MSGSSRNEDIGGLGRQPTGKQPETDRNERVAQPAPKKGGILKALRRSPLVGEDAIPPRPNERGCKVDL